MDFFYPNFINDMWRVFGIIYFNNKDYFFDIKNKTIDKTGIQQMLIDHKIGVGETTKEAIRTKDNASDKFLEIVTPVNLPELLSKIPLCEAIATTGEKAASVIAGLTNSNIPKIGEFIEFEMKMNDGQIRRFQHWRMPSTSRAFPMKLETKTGYYRDMLSALNLL